MGDTDNSLTYTNQTNDTDSQASQANYSPVLDMLNHDNDIPQRLETLEERLISLNTK